MRPDRGPGEQVIGDITRTQFTRIVRDLLADAGAPPLPDADLHAWWRAIRRGPLPWGTWTSDAVRAIRVYQRNHIPTPTAIEWWKRDVPGPTAAALTADGFTPAVFDRTLKIHHITGDGRVREARKVGPGWASTDLPVRTCQRFLDAGVTPEEYTRVWAPRRRAGEDIEPTLALLVGLRPEQEPEH